MNIKPAERIVKRYTWEGKIESLVTLAKAVGRYTNAEAGTDYHTDARKKLDEAYEEFCQWRHDEPYLVDEIKQLLNSHLDEETGIRMAVEQDNPEYPGHLKITVICPVNNHLLLEEINAALGRLRTKAGISYEQFPDLVYAQHSEEEERWQEVTPIALIARVNLEGLSCSTTWATPMRHWRRCIGCFSI